MIEASKGSEYVGEDPATDQETAKIDQDEGDSQQGEGEGGNGKNTPSDAGYSPSAKEETGQTKQSTLDPGPPPPTEPPPVKEKTKESPKAQGKGTNIEQVTALFKADSKLYYQACKEVEINEVLSEASALTVLKKADEISKRPKGKK